jgi:hypothetical protein
VTCSANLSLPEEGSSGPQHFITGFKVRARAAECAAGWELCNSDSLKMGLYFLFQNHRMLGAWMLFLQLHDKVQGLHGKFSANRSLSYSHFSNVNNIFLTITLMS